MNPAERTERIRKLNDTLRQKGTGGRFMLTAGVAALELDVLRRVLEAVRSFTDFGHDNDPHSEHDCAVIEVADLTVIWKVDAYDRSLDFASPDPTDPTVTIRVITVMLAAEY